MLFKQGEKPEYVFVVLEGEIELTRERNFGMRLMDPTKEDKISLGKKLPND